MSMKQKISLVFLFVLPFSALAFTKYEPQEEPIKEPIKETIFQKILRCTWHISCYFTPNVGSFTPITTATVIKNFPDVYNANLDKTIEVGTTSVPTITTLSGLTTASNLASVGTITSGPIVTGKQIGRAHV